MSLGGPASEPVFGRPIVPAEQSSQSLGQQPSITSDLVARPAAWWERQSSAVTPRPVVPAAWLRRVPGGGTVYAPPAPEDDPAGS